MKKFFSFVLLVATTLFLSSCDKDKDAKPSSSFTYDGNTYTLTKGYIYLNWDEQGIYEKSVILGAKEYYQLMLEPSDYVTISLKTNNSAMTIPDGTYEFSQEFVANTFNWGSVAVNYNMFEETGTMNEDFSGGTVTVSEGGTKFVFTIQFADGNEMTGTFKGTLEVID